MIIDIKGQVIAVVRRPRGKLSVTKVVVEQREDDKFYRTVIEFFGRDEDKAAGVKAGDQVSIKTRIGNGREWKDDWFDANVGLQVTKLSEAAAPSDGATHADDLPF